jgi:8-oxo-dGTP pyrophosphatase MutT (NUDIX family)
VSDLPTWLEPVRAGVATITTEDLTQFLAPDDADPRRGAVLMLFADGDEPTVDDGRLLLTERAHQMRSHPGQVSFPGGSIDPGETAVEAALREAEEETGLDPAGVEVFGELPELWLPPSNFSVTPVLGWWRAPSPVRVVDPGEVHAIHQVRLADLLQHDHRILVRHPSGWVGPAFLIGPDRDVILWGFTAGVITRLFDFLGWATPWDDYEIRDLPSYMLQGVTRRPIVPPAPTTPPREE